MKRFLAVFSALLLVVAAGGAEVTRTFFGPDGKVAMPGKYYVVSTHDDGPPTTALVLDTKSATVQPPTVPPVTPPVTPPVNPPAPAEISAKLDALIAAVNDPDKAEVSKGVAETYRQMLLLVSSGLLKDPQNVKTATKFALETVLQKTGKIAAWQGFVTGMDTLTAGMDLPVLVNTYQLVQAKLGGPVNPDPPPVPQPGAKQVTYVFEKDQTSVPPQVAAELQRLNAAGLAIATEFEDDTVNGLGVTPLQYKTALDAARAVGLPALVVQTGGTVTKTVKAPTTAAQVAEALK
jgi:hypothetical protein